MNLVFNIALHLLLAGSILVFATGLIWSSLIEPNPRERLLRIAGLVAGALVALGAQVAGMDYAKFIVESLASGGFLVDAVATAMPGLLGICIGLYALYVFKQSEKLAMRVLSFIGMLTSVAYLLIYAEATKAKGVFLGSASIPNVAFVTGLILAMVFAHEPESGRDAGVRRFLSTVFRRRFFKDGDFARLEKPTRRDPFSS